MLVHPKCFTFSGEPANFLEHFSWCRQQVFRSFVLVTRFCVTTHQEWGPRYSTGSGDKLPQQQSIQWQKDHRSQSLLPFWGTVTSPGRASLSSKLKLRILVPPTSKTRSGESPSPGRGNAPLSYPTLGQDLQLTSSPLLTKGNRTLPNS